jgi:hypothetical protein
VPAKRGKHTYSAQELSSYQHLELCNALLAALGLLPM